jgi:hypothetical protein
MSCRGHVLQLDYAIAIACMASRADQRILVTCLLTKLASTRPGYSAPCPDCIPFLFSTFYIPDFFYKTIIRACDHSSSVGQIGNPHNPVIMCRDHLKWLRNIVSGRGTWHLVRQKRVVERRREKKCSSPRFPQWIVVAGNLPVVPDHSSHGYYSLGLLSSRFPNC